MTTIDLDLAGRRVLVVGSAPAARHSLARLARAGATVFLLGDTPDAAATAPARHLAEPRTAIAWREALAALDLVVLCGAEERLVAAVRRAVAGTRTWVTVDEPAPVGAVGTVTLVGGGPGADELMTLAGRAALARADVVFFDRLAPHERLAEWAPGAELVDVGKTPGHHAVPQGEIETRLVTAALAGRTVVRLKGGDPFVFGRGAEEVAACHAAGVAVSVVSGVTSAIAVPAAAGIPVTHRETSRLFTVVSGHAPLDEATLAHLVGLGGTLVVLMGVMNLPHLSAGLTRAGMARDMPLAIVERGLTRDQRTTVTTLDEAVGAAHARGVGNPAVLVIGEVVRLSHDPAAAAESLAETVSVAADR